MSLNISTNTAAASANFYLSRNNLALQKSLTRLASGSRVINPADDAGGLAVAMKLGSSISRLGGAEKNIQNAMSFLEVQDGILETVGQIVDRMSELKGLYHDVMKNSSDQDSYNNEFKDLQVQLYEMSFERFNNVSLFAQFTEINGSTSGRFNAGSQLDNTLNVYISEDGESGTKVSLHKAMLLSALTISLANNSPATYSSGNQSTTMKFAVPSLDGTGTVRPLGLADVSVGVFNTVIQNVAGLRSQNGAAMSRLRFASDNVNLQKANLVAAKSRIMDVDMAGESTNLSKQNFLVQASAAMLAQANASTEVALILLR
jgi:flagellin